MKRFLVLLLGCTILWSSIGFAEVDVDLSQYSIEELILLRTAVENEINIRVTTATAVLEPGKYVVGMDIVAGSYILVGLMDKAPNGYTPQVLYAESMEMADDWEYIDFTYLETGEKWRANLREGMVLEIRYGECSIQQAAPLMFAPK